MKEIFIDQVVSTIGKKIRTLREQQHLSLNQVAEKAGVSSTTVHKLERNEMTPTVTVLMKIADALGEKVGFFFEEEDNHFGYVQGVEYTPQKNRKKFRNTPGNTRVEYMAIRLRDAKMLSMLILLEPGTMSGVKKQSHLGEEFIYSLGGEIRYEIEGNTYLLKKGDCLHFHSHIPHRWEVTGSKGSKTLWLITPPPVGGFTELWK